MGVVDWEWWIGRGEWKGLSGSGSDKVRIVVVVGVGVVGVVEWAW